MMNITKALYFIRSAHAPVNISGTIKANVIWNPAYSNVDIVGPASLKQLLASIPLNNAKVRGFP